MFEKNLREVCSRLIEPTDIPAEADGNYVVDAIRNPRKKHVIKTLPYKRHKPPDLDSEPFPKVPVIVCKSFDDVHSQELMDFCLHPKTPVTIIRDACKMIGLNLEYFTTRSLTARAPEALIEIRKQVVQNPDFNINNGKLSWLCESPRMWKTLRQHGAYQTKLYHEKNGKHNPNTITYGEELEFGTNLDLSDDKVWKEELAELKKLPFWMQVSHKRNFLNYVDQKVLGVNTVQTYIKVPGSRTPGHQENLNTNAININIGPGDTSWLSTPEEYWPLLDDLCRKNRVKYLEDPWWPAIDELVEAGIPVHRYVQRPGDIVILNAGTPHWVQADGFCNNIAWNTLPLSAFHYSLAMERYELNMQRQFQSLVPMERATWNLANSGVHVNFALFAQIRFFLQRCIFNLVSSLKRLKEQRVRIFQQSDDHQLRFCEECDKELFSLLWIRESDDPDAVALPYCESCAQKDMKSTWIVIQQYTVRKLQLMYDKLKIDWKN